MYRIAIYDEDAESIINTVNIIRTACKGRIGKANIHRFNDDKLFLEEYNRNDIQYDIIIIGVYLPDMKGFELAGRIRESDKEILIIFISSYTECVYRAFDYNPVQYVRKEFQDSELSKVLKNCIDILDMNVSRYICISNKDGEQRLLLKEIMYIEKQDKKIIISMNNHKKFIIRDTIKTFSERIFNVETFFVMINSGCIINLRYLERMDALSAYMNDGAKLPISRRYHKKVSEKYILVYS